MRKYKTFKTVIFALILYFLVFFFFLKPKFGPQIERVTKSFEDPTSLDMGSNLNNKGKSNISKDNLNDKQLAAFKKIISKYDLSDQVTIKSLEESEFSDTSLGCPDPETNYTKTVTPGFIFNLENEQGINLNYRISKDLNISVKCPT